MGSPKDIKAPMLRFRRNFTRGLILMGCVVRLAYPVRELLGRVFIFEGG
jgi:hypothetical protein